MSHVKTSDVIVKDLDCLREAVKKFPKLSFVEGQKKFTWYGEWVNDYDNANAAYKHGISTEDYGKCDHAIRMEGVAYEIGLMKRKDGEGYSVVWDFYGCGRRIDEYIGHDGEKLMTEYNRLYIEKFAMENGFTMQVEEDAKQLIQELVDYSS